MAPESTSIRLVRLLSLIAYLQVHNRAAIADLAARFDVSEEQIRKDVELLWVTGLPGGTHADLIDFVYDDFEQGIVTLQASQGVDRIFGFSDREAIALSGALGALAATVSQLGVDDAVRDLLDETLAALRRAEPHVTSALDVNWYDTVAPGVYNLIRQAIAARTRMRIDYTNVTDDHSERVVEPLRIAHVQGYGYLDAWCTTADEFRRFRLDRINEVTVLSEPTATTVLPDNLPTGFTMTADTDAASVRITLASPARTVAENVPHVGLTDHEDGSFTIELRTTNQRWLTQLLAAHADHVLAVSAPQVWDSVRVRARQALARYSLDECGSGSG